MSYKIVSKGAGLHVLDLETGKPAVRGLCALTLRAEVDHMTTAELELMTIVREVDAVVDAISITVMNPTSGFRRRVRRVEYEDGGGFEVIDGRLFKIQEVGE